MASGASFSRADGVEIACFLMLSAIAAHYHPIDEAAWWTTLPLNYAAAYSIARVAMAFQQRPSVKSFWMELHRFVGSFGVLYSLVAWYKVVVLAGQPFSSGHWELLHVAARGLAALSTLMNTMTGIALFPHVNRQTPLVLRQTFTCGASIDLATWLLWLLSLVRAHFPQGGILSSFLAFTTVVWSLLAFLMGWRIVQVLGQGARPQNVDKPETNSSNKGPPNTLTSYFYEVFVRPSIYRGSMQAKVGIRYLASNNKAISQAVVVSALTAPGAIMVLMTLNLALNYKTLPVFGPGTLSNPVALRFSLALLEQLSFGVIPANMFDLTLVLRNRLSPQRAAIEISASLLCSLVIAPLWATVLLSSNNASQYGAYLEALLRWPLRNS